MAMGFRSCGFLVVSCLFILLIGEGCKSSKQGVYNGPPIARTQDEVVQSLLKRNIDFEFISIKGTADFEALGMGGSGTMNLRIKKNNIIWIQGKKLGIEGFRGIITHDSFTMVNRLDGSYFYEPNEAISSLFGVSFRFDEIQELMGGNILSFSDAEVSDYIQADNQCKLSLNNAKYNILLIIDANTLELREYHLKDRNGNSALAQFSDYRKTEKVKAPTPYTRNYYFKSREGDEGKIELNITELEFNIEKSLIFNLPLHYDRVRL